MKVTIQSFSQLNDYLEKADNKLHQKPEKASAVHEKIQLVLRDHLNVVNGAEFTEVRRFIHSIKHVASPSDNLEKLAIDSVVAVSGSLGLDEIHKYKELDETLYYQSLANHISNNKRPLKSLNLSDREMLKVAPWVTYLDLTDVRTGRRAEGTFTDAFIQRFLENATQLKSLILKNSKITGTAFSNIAVLEALKNLKHLEIKFCPAFNQNIQGLPHLKTLKIETCAAFNGRITDLPSLKELKLLHCETFNHSLNGLQNLVKLSITYCRRYNRTLKGLHHLGKLKILGSEFNRRLSDLPSLHTLTLRFLPSFNHRFKDLPQVTWLQIDECSSLEVKDLRTAKWIHQLALETFSTLFAQTSPARQTRLIEALLNRMQEATSTIQQITPETREDLMLILALNIPEEEIRERIPLIPALMELYEIEGLVIQRENGNAIKNAFKAVQERPNYLEALQIAIQGFPDLAAFLIRNLQDEIDADLKRLNFSDLSQESKIALLPLFTPDLILEIIHSVDDDIKAQWLDAEVAYDLFEGKTFDVLTQIATHNIQGADQQSFDNLLAPIRDLLAKIPFGTLAVMAAIAPDTMLAYTFAFNDAQNASTIPLLPEEVFVQHLKTKPLPTHRELLLYASAHQKAAYIHRDLLSEPQALQRWNQAVPKLKAHIKRFNKEKTRENFQSLDQAWREILNEMNLPARTYLQTAQSLVKLFPDGSPYFDQKIKKAQEALTELKTYAAQIEALEGKVEGQITIPDEFVDSITGEIMTEPYYHPKNRDYVYDLSTWKQMPKHPATRASIHLDELVLDSELKTRIDTLKKKHS